ncbi:DUF5906 domain-containing protein [Cryobacterium fucosi]|uniref:SF3 helicase domain-containing protein n=1 Tax=Cryobacterium fucosi TaxID=1259157 RepID=A0A4R9BDY8_9MICO|nr:DUF5906 domain-containing protein [Cryobacterium fucosi]TFD80365.1 hypothetical protein E3T48_04925 [Cryobacterium fucosi]
MTLPSDAERDKEVQPNLVRAANPEGKTSADDHALPRSSSLTENSYERPTSAEEGSIADTELPPDSHDELATHNGENQDSKLLDELPQQWSRAERINYVTKSYLEGLAGLDPAALPAKLTSNSELVARSTLACIREWYGEDGKERPVYVPGGPPAALTAWQLAMLAARWHRIRRIAHAGLGDTTLDELGFYQSAGANRGLFVADESALRALILGFDQDVSDPKMREIIGKLYDIAPRVEKTSDRDAIPCKSRVFDFKTKTQRDYDPDVDVFTSKLAVDCPRTEPEEPMRFLSDRSPWQFSDWLLDLFEPLDDAEDVANTVWEIISASVRPGVRWNKMAFFYSTLGESGKGTLVEMIQHLFGEGSGAYCSIPLDAWGGPGNDFKLEPLLTAFAVLVDENNVGEHLTFLANLKAAVTGDRIPINRKGRRVITIRFRGFIVQCVNALLSTKDKSSSFSRRQLFVPFPKSFTGAAFPEIKETFLSDTKVLEYVLWRVLHMTHYTLSEPKSCRDLKEEAQIRNDLVREFWVELREHFAWDLLPFPFLHHLFEAWRVRENPGSKPMGKQTFTDRLMEAVRNDQLWFSDGRDRVINRAQRMLGEEPMLHGYGVPSDSWNNKAKTYKGLQRRTSLPGSLQELTDLQARDNADWERRAVEDDGVVDPAHVRDHARIRRMGSGCTCPPRGGATKPQPALTAAVKRSRAIGLALVNAQADADARAKAAALVDAS